MLPWQRTAPAAALLAAGMARGGDQTQPEPYRALKSAIVVLALCGGRLLEFPSCPSCGIHDRTLGGTGDILGHRGHSD